MYRIFAVVLFCLPVWAFAQDIYLGTQFKLYKLDLASCQIEELPYIPSREQKLDLIHGLAFHPNGKLYASTYYDILELDLKTGKAKHLIRSPERYTFLATLAINEEGRMIVNSGGYFFLDYDLFHNRLSPQYRFGSEGPLLFTWGFYDARHLINDGISKDFSSRYLLTLDLETGTTDTLIEFNGNEIEYAMAGVTKYYDNCKNRYYIGQAHTRKRNDENFKGFFGQIDFGNGTLDKICKEKMKEVVVGIGSTDNFRHNGFLVDMDADNSSGHMTGGFYDTLTPCNPVGRIADDDISYRLCDEEIDSISFRIKSFGEPGPPNEEMTASETLERAGPKRWTWHNPYGRDTEKISDFLRSVRYEPEWSEKGSYERTVVTTSYIAGDSTSSWSVFQLIGTDTLAGRDTVVTYCGAPDFIDLRKHMSSSADRNGGRFEPALSSGNTLFIPGKDQEGEYRYIVESAGGGCLDTAVFTIKMDGDRSLGLKRHYIICRGTEIAGLAQLPHPGYDSVLWWNGDTTWSTEIQQDDYYPLWVRAMKDGCVYRDTLSLYETSGSILHESWYTDTLLICKGSGKRVNVANLDSLLMKEQMYYKEDSITFLSEGTYAFRGFREDCVIDKEIEVMEWDPQTTDFSKVFSWCQDSVLTIHLPEAIGMEFSWSDGTPGALRTIDDYGEYPFRVSIGSCDKEYFYTVVPDNDCDEECTVSIPNAITPNGDGINDNLEVFSDCAIEVTHIRIFDKWGGELYHVQGGEVEAQIWEDFPPGVVMVQVTYVTNGGVVKTIGGGVLVVK